MGKSTLARALADASEGATYLDLEDPRTVARLQEPMLSLEPLRGLVVLDEVQRRPDLFPVLRVLADRPRRPARFLVLGSASPELLAQSSETLAGRLAIHVLPGFDLTEIGERGLDRLWVRGGFPRAFTARTDAESMSWRGQFVRTFAEREVAALRLGLAAPAVDRFWRMLAHYHGQLWNGADIARSLAVSEKTARHYLDVLVGTYVVRRLPPWHQNAGKREVKAPKIFIADSGLLHALLGVGTRHELLGHPKAGASWEGFVLEHVMARLGAEPQECFFWGVHTGAELDLLVVRGSARRGFEVKLTESPSVTRSMRSAMEALGLSRLDVIHAGPDTFPLAPDVRALSAHRLSQDLPG